MVIGCASYVVQEVIEIIIMLRRAFEEMLRKLPLDLKAYFSPGL